MPKEDTTMSDHEERILNALEESTRVTTEVVGQIRGMEREFLALRESQAKEFAHLRDTFDGRLGDLEEEMKSTNAHLDNLVRETVVTNQLLREDMDDRKVQDEHRRKIENEERDWRRDMETRKLDRAEDLEDENRTMLQKGFSEFWGVFKQPFGYLVAGVIFWLLIRYFAVPPNMLAATVTEPPATEQTSP